MLVDLGIKAAWTCCPPSKLQGGFAYSHSGSYPCGVIKGPGTGGSHSGLDGSGSTKAWISLPGWRW